MAASSRTARNAVYYRKTLEDPERRDEVFEKQLANLYPGATLEVGDLQQPVQTSRSPSRSLHIHRAVASSAATTAAATSIRTARPRTFSRPMRSRLSQPGPDDPGAVREPHDDDLSTGRKRAFDQVPDDVDIDTKFGSVKVDYRRDGDTLEIEIRYSIDVQRVSVEDYPAFREFVTEMTARSTRPSNSPRE